MQKSGYQKFDSSTAESGFSVIELIIVVVIIAILTTGILVTFDRRKMYAADDQSLLVVDAMQKARQLAITFKSVVRVEINETKNNIQIFDEKKSNTTNDDVLLQTVTLKTGTTIGDKPGNVTQNPTASYPIPETTFSTSSYPTVANDKTMTFRFTLTGNVLDAGNDNIGTNANITGATIFISNAPWDANGNAEIVRAVTLSGISGDTAIQKGLTNSGGYIDAWKR